MGRAWLCVFSCQLCPLHHRQETNVAGEAAVLCSRFATSEAVVAFWALRVWGNFSAEGAVTERYRE